MLTIADGGVRGVQEPLILADVICKQLLRKSEDRRCGKCQAGLPLTIFVFVLLSS